MEKKPQVGEKMPSLQRRPVLFDSLATHTETLDEMVIYKDFAGNVWARPLEMFFETILVDGEKVRRFELVEE